MKILFPDIHYTLTTSMSLAFHALGHEMIIPSSDYKATNLPPTRPWTWGDQWTQEYVDKNIPRGNAVAMNKEEILDSNIDALCITAYENQFEILSEIWPVFKQRGAKLFWFSGNNYGNQMYPTYYIKNHLCADFPSFQRCKEHQINHLYYKPWLRYDKYPYKGPSDNLVLGSYICDYEKNFPNEYNFYKSLEAEAEKTGVKFNLHTKSTEDEVCESIHESMAGVHIKIDGYGYALLHCLAAGRPVFLHRNLRDQCSYQNWCLENISAFYVQSPEEFRVKLKAYVECQDYRHWMQETAAKTVRQIVNNEEQTENLDNFLNNLV